MTKKKYTVTDISAMLNLNNVIEKSDATTNTSENKSDGNNATDFNDSFLFEQALQLTGVGVYSRSILALSVYALLAAVVEMFSVGVLVTSSQCDLDLDIKKKGLIGAVPMLGVVGGAHFWGYLADTRGRRFALLLSTAGTFIGAVISGFATDWIFMVVAKLLTAICASGTNAGIFTLLGESIPETIRGKYLMCASTGIMLSQAATSLLSYPILRLEFIFDIPFMGITYRPWRMLCQVIGLTNALTFVLLYFFTYESPKFYFAKGEHDQGLEILKKIHKRNSNDKIAHFLVKQVILNEDVNKAKNTNIFQSVWNQTVPMFYKKHIKHTLLVCYICIVAYCVCPPFITWLPLIFNSFSTVTSPNTSFCEMLQTPEHLQNTTANPMECDDRIEDFTFIALAFFALYLGSMSIISVFITKFIGKKKFFICIHLLCACMAVIVDNVNSLWGLITFVMMQTNIVCMGITTIYAVELFPTYMRAMAVCLTVMVGRGTSFIFVNLLGTQLLNNCNAMIYFLAAFLLSGAIIGFLLPAEKKIQNAQDLENK